MNTDGPHGGRPALAKQSPSRANLAKARNYKVSTPPNWKEARRRHDALRRTAVRHTLLAKIRGVATNAANSSVDDELIADDADLLESVEASDAAQLQRDVLDYECMHNSSVLCPVCLGGTLVPVFEADGRAQLRTVRCDRCHFALTLGKALSSTVCGTTITDAEPMTAYLQSVFAHHAHCDSGQLDLGVVPRGDDDDVLFALEAPPDAGDRQLGDWLGLSCARCGMHYMERVP